MLFTQAYARTIAVLTIFTCLSFELPAIAKGAPEAIKATIQGDINPADVGAKKPLLIAQAASCASCGADLDPLLLI